MGTQIFQGINMLFLTFLLSYLSQAVPWDYQQSISNRINHKHSCTCNLQHLACSSPGPWQARASLTRYLNTLTILCPTSHTGNEIAWKLSSRGQPQASLSPRLTFPLMEDRRPFLMEVCAAFQEYHWHNDLWCIFLNGLRWKLWSRKNSASTS